MKKLLMAFGLLTLTIACESSSTDSSNNDTDRPMTEQDSTIRDLEEASEVLLR